MTSPLTRCVLVTTTAAALAVSGAATAGGSAPAPDAVRAPHHAAALGSHCLIGTWKDGASWTTTRWKGKTVRMRYRGGDVDHIASTGIDKDNWQKSKELVGRVHHHKLVEHIRGHNKLRFTVIAKGTVRVAEKGWTQNSTNRYVYKGHKKKGYLNQHGHYRQYFHCNASTLTWRSKKGKVLSRETRVSRNP
jgi:hypothetical protein